MVRKRNEVSIYERTLPEIVATEDTAEMPFDCDGCHRKFTVKELADFTTPFANRGEQSGKIKCPQCGHEMNVQFAADSIQ